MGQVDDDNDDEEEEGLVGWMVLEMVLPVL
jgi:hypothetical protein